jgi:hypothetical protein
VGTTRNSKSSAASAVEMSVASRGSWRASAMLCSGSFLGPGRRGERDARILLCSVLPFGLLGFYCEGEMKTNRGAAVATLPGPPDASVPCTVRCLNSALVNVQKLLVNDTNGYSCRSCGENLWQSFCPKILMTKYAKASKTKSRLSLIYIILKIINKIVSKYSIIMACTFDS